METGKSSSSVGSFSTLMAWMGGVQLSVLDKCDVAVKQRRALMGGLLFATVFVSSLLAGLAWTLASHSIITGISVAVVWFFVLGLLDMNLMSNMNGKGGKDTALKTAALMISRVLIIFVLAHLNSHFVQLWMFDREIVQKIAISTTAKNVQNDANLKASQDAYEDWYNSEKSKVDEALAAAVKNYDKWYTAERVRVDVASEKAAAARKAFVDEVEGKSGTGKPGYAEASKAKEAEAKKLEDAASKEAQALEDAARESTFAQAVELAKKEKLELDDRAKKSGEYDALEKAKIAHQKLEQEIKTLPADGLANRSQALAEVAKDDPLVHWIYALFMLIEMLAFLVKLLSGEDEYDARLTNMQLEVDDKFAAEALEKNSAKLDNMRLAQEADAEYQRFLVDQSEANANNVVKTLGSKREAMSALKGHVKAVKALSAEMGSAGISSATKEAVGKNIQTEIMKLFP